jgi:predicted DNA-binding antitoxin AbrB/MazE fold protein
MQGLEIDAVYEKGTLKLPRELPLVEGATVRITIHPPGGVVGRAAAAYEPKLSREDIDVLLGPDNHPWARTDDLR